MRFLTNALDGWRVLDSRSKLRAGYVLIALLAVALAWSALSGKTAQLERKRSAREAVLKELLPLKIAYRAAKQSSDRITSKMSGVRPDDSPAKIIDEIGIKGRSLKISQVKGDERTGILEDAADVRIEGLTANEALNLLYRLEKGGRPVMLKKTSLRVRFDDPSRFDLFFTMALLKPAPGQGR